MGLLYNPAHRSRPGSLSCGRGYQPLVINAGFLAAHQELSSMSHGPQRRKGVGMNKTVEPGWEPQISLDATGEPMSTHAQPRRQRFTGRRVAEFGSSMHPA